MRVTAWALALCFLAVAVLGWRYFFAAPILFSVAIAVCLALAAWRSTSPDGEVRVTAGANSVN